MKRSSHVTSVTDSIRVVDLIWDRWVMISYESVMLHNEKMHSCYKSNWCHIHNRNTWMFSCDSYVCVFFMWLICVCLDETHMTASLVTHKTHESLHVTHMKNTWMYSCYSYVYFFVWLICETHESLHVTHMKNTWMSSYVSNIYFFMWLIWKTHESLYVTHMCRHISESGVSMSLICVDT